MYGRDERKIEKRKYLAIMLERTLVSINMVMKRDNVKKSENRTSRWKEGYECWRKLMTHAVCLPSIRSGC